MLDGIQEVAETFVIYKVKKPTDEARRLAGILAAQAVQLSEAIGEAGALKGIEPHVRQIHELEHEADGLSRAAIARLFRDGIEAIEVIKRRDVYTAPREHDRRRRGRGRGHRADRRQEPERPERAPGGLRACGRSSSRPRSASITWCTRGSPAIVSLTWRRVCVSWSSTRGSATSPLHSTLSSVISAARAGRAATQRS